MKFYIMHPVTAPPRGELIGQIMQEALEAAELADRVGFDGFLLPEHHGTAVGFLPSPLVFTAAIAARTRRMEVGSAVVLPALHDPIRLAEDAAVVDQLSGGRLTLGVGVGGRPHEYEMFGVDPKTRGSRTMEALAVIYQAWSGDQVEFDGRYYHVHGVRVTPNPVQSPRPPVFLGIGGPRSMAWAAEYADAAIIDPLHGLETVRRQAAAYRGETERAGKKPRVVLFRECWVAPSFEQALDECWDGLRQTLTMFWTNSTGLDEPDSWAAGVKRREDITPENIDMSRFIIGSPEQCAARLQVYAEAGVDDFLLAIRHGTRPSQEATLRCMELFASQVMPRCR